MNCSNFSSLSYYLNALMIIFELRGPHGGGGERRPLLGERACRAGSRQVFVAFFVAISSNRFRPFCFHLLSFPMVINKIIN